jgi:hypothetical protein
MVLFDAHFVHARLYVTDAPVSVFVTSACWPHPVAPGGKIEASAQKAYLVSERCPGISPASSPIPATGPVMVLVSHMPFPLMMTESSSTNLAVALRTLRVIGGV